MAATRRASVQALAKLNLSLKVLEKRRDGFHEMRTVFQTISLGDEIDIEFTPGRRSSIRLEEEVPIPANLVGKAARLVMDSGKIRGEVHLRLKKRIPLGGGLGGGSSDAAAVLLALPVLGGVDFPMQRLVDLGADLGSDVPFFLYGGRALGIGRGTEVYPLEDLPKLAALVVAPQVHVSTADAYRALNRKLTPELSFQYIGNFQSHVWNREERSSGRGGLDFCENDFQAVVFEQYPQLKSVQEKLSRLGADPAMLTGSGAALFGVFGSRREASAALPAFAGLRAFPVTLIGRGRYQSMWRRWLSGHVDLRRMDTEKVAWPLPSRYAR
jgi:4-diphosphocytidyl-2-C-methyl-D-erythritol kinase